jgi:hypothetical protein
VLERLVLFELAYEMLHLDVHGAYDTDLHNPDLSLQPKGGCPLLTNR